MSAKSASPPRTAAKPAHWLNGAYPLLWIAIGAFLIYGQSVGFSYTFLDDHNLILSQMSKISHLSYIPQAFREDVFHTPGGGGVYYRPILTVSFVIDAVIGGGSLKAFHISNIIFHILAAFLLFLCLAALTPSRLKAFLGSLLFLFHPVVTQAVAWIPGRNDTLLAVFILASFYFFIQYVQHGKLRDALLHAVAWFLALLTKETAIILPLLLLPAGLLLFKVPLRKLAIPIGSWIGLGLIWLLIRASVLGNATAYTTDDSLASLIRNLPALMPFLGKSLFPFQLSVFPILPDMWISSILGGLSVIILVLLVVVSRPRNTGYFLFSIFWFLLFLLPTFIKHTQTPDLTEHRIYLPLTGIILFFMVSGPVNTMDLRNLTPKILSFGLIGLFAVLTIVHLQAFKDRYAFWNNAVKTSPTHAYNYNTLGAMYFLDGDLEQAEPYFRKALQLNPSEPQANSNIGLVAMRKGDFAEAEKFYKTEIRVNPTYDHVYYNYGLLYYQKGQVDSAIISWEKTIVVNPTYTDAYQALMLIYDTLRRQNDYYRIVELAQKNGLINP